ncbi:AI-2E family transporter [Natronoflexus pectinivorans]|uniref:Putative PurR-regulated permease PerM n=1 Tax=Natronoflexus pectinivorans TaxID=682526 RepID=A0A4R2GP86_9BACT|nr:AI-2E family transporter [Natronoflexus pectinivorans]TCO11092.1 putative PurR-regulated permease PerM [Natronoflexus pectinivorans]
MEEKNYPLQSEKRYLLVKRTAVVLLAIFLFIYGLMAIRNFLYPIAFGLVLAYLVYPLTRWFEIKGIHRILANFIVIMGTLAFITGLIIAAYHIITPISIDFADLTDKAIDNIAEMIVVTAQYFGIETNNVGESIRNQLGSATEAGGEQLGKVFTATTNTIVAFGLLPVYIFLFLYYRTKFMYFLLGLAGRSRRKKMVTMLREIAAVMVQYQGGVLLVVFILFFINSIGLWIVGVQFAIPLGVTAALFNFIPYFGTLLGGAVPLIFAFLVEGDPILAFKVVILFIVVQFIENNILTPNIVGGNVKINPFFIITGLVAASMVWGIPGMLLIVPFLASIKIIFKHIDFMKPYAFLLGEKGTEKHSIKMDKFKRIWKRVKKKIKK